MKTLIRLLGWLLVIQVAFHVVFYILGGMEQGLNGLGAIFDADLVRLTAGLTAIYLCRGHAMEQ
jgi:hypothetical protein